MRLVVDGLAFLSGRPDPLWLPLLQRLSRMPQVDLVLLDRGGLPSVLRAAAVPFPAHPALGGAADSVLIQQVCDALQADAFTSTGASTPLSLPMALMLPAAAPGFDTDSPECEVAVAYAQHFVCRDELTRARLLAWCPEVPADCITVADLEAEQMAEALSTAIEHAMEESAAGRYTEFFAQWQRVRNVQAAVDYRSRGLDVALLARPPA